MTGESTFVEAWRASAENRLAACLGRVRGFCL
jgi:hypothetical protein